MRAVSQDTADGLLPVLRALCQGAAPCGGVPLAPRAMAAAQEAWGAGAMARTVALAHLLAELRLSRRAVFHYANPDCPCCRLQATPNERAFLALARAGLAGQRSAATGAALILTEGGPVEPVCNAALALRAIWAAAPGQAT